MNTRSYVFISVHKIKTSNYFQKPLKVLILKGKMVGLGGLEPPTSPLSGLTLIHLGAWSDKLEVKSDKPCI